MPICFHGRRTGSTLLLLLVFLQGVWLKAEALRGGERRSLFSAVLGEKRTYTLYLPEAGTGPDHCARPLIVVLDGNDFADIVASTCRYLASVGRMPPVVVVGVDAADRWRDYTPTRANIPDGTPLPTSGGGALFRSFLVQDLIPAIGSIHPVSPFVVVFGHSVAGLAAVDALLEDPEHVAGAIASSPSLWWDGEYTLRRLKERPSAFRKEQYMFLSMGGEGDTMLLPAKRFRDALAKWGAESIALSFQHLPERDHQQVPLWSIPLALSVLFGDWQMPARVLEGGQDAVVAYYQGLSHKYRQRLQVPETVFNRLGYTLLKKGETEAALKAFQTCLDQYPDSANAHDSMGEACLKAGRRKDALKHYRRALVLNPGNANAARVIGTLEREDRPKGS